MRAENREERDCRSRRSTYQTPGIILGRCLVKAVDGVVNLAVLAVFLLLLAYGCYALWDSRQVVDQADPSEYTVYKPSAEDSLSFAELQAINPDVFGWLTIYGTNVDYPLVQGEDNSRYVNTDAKGNYSLSGSLFLDYRNSDQFLDFASIIYGHDMAEKKMFGELASFQEAEFFDSHRYGNLYFGGKDHGVEFFAFLEADAYDTSVYNPGVSPEGGMEYLDNLLDKAVNRREISVTEEDHLVLLSTCTAGTTNGRHILVGKITEKPWPDPYQ